MNDERILASVSKASWAGGNAKLPRFQLAAGFGQCCAADYFSFVRPVRTGVAEEQAITWRPAGDEDVKIVRALHDGHFAAGLQRVPENLCAIGTDATVIDGRLDFLDSAIMAEARGGRGHFFERNFRVFVEIFLQAFSRVAHFPQLVGAVGMEHENESLGVYPQEGTRRARDHRVEDSLCRPRRHGAATENDRSA